MLNVTQTKKMNRQPITLRSIAFLLSVLCFIVVSTVNADSLRVKILDKLKHGLDVTDTNEHSDASLGEISVNVHLNSAETDDSSPGVGLLQVNSASSPVDTGLIQVDSSASAAGDEGLIQTHAEANLDLQNQIKFTCYSKNETSCASQNCVWVGNVCTISPHAFVLQCKLYCFESSCIVPLVGKYDSESPCIPKPEVYQGLCSAVRTEELCNLQGGLCAWRSRKCTEAPSCCSKAKKYCDTQDHVFLKSARNECEAFTTEEGLCNFSSKNCEMTILN